MDRLEFQKLTITAEGKGPFTIKWLGVSQARDPAASINPYIEKLAGELGAGPVEVDFTELEYMNSSTVTPIIAMCQLFDKKGIATTLRYDAGSSWQTATFKALITLSRVMKNITVVSA